MASQPLLQPLLPQRLTDARAEIASVEWLVEPFWPGLRLLARVSDGAATFTDASGEPVVDASLVAVMVAGVGAASAVVDGVLTSMHLDDSAADPFVAVDLLELDRQSLLDVPFQERRRLLTSVVAPGPRLAVSSAVKPPLAGWFGAWRENGFSHCVARHQNARYRPGERADDCLKLPLPSTSGSAPSFGSRLFGSRERTRRIED